MKKGVKVNTIQIGPSETVIPAKDCFKIKVRNDSPGSITVDGLVIEPQREETFDGLPQDHTFIDDFELSTSDARVVVVFVTRYFYKDHCK